MNVEYGFNDLMDLAAAHAVLGGEGYDELMAQDDANDHTVSFHPGRLTSREIAVEYDEAAWAQRAKLTTIIPNGADFARRRIVLLLQDFVRFHVSHANGKHVGKELANDKSLIFRCKMFVGWLVAHSLKIQRGTRKPILDVDGNKQYMSSTTLLKVMQNLFKMLAIYAKPQITMNQKDHYKSEMNKLYQEAVKVYRLKIYDRVLTVLYAPDIIQLIEYNWSDCEGNYDLAVQTHLLLLTFLFTGARPGSILRTRKYMDCYLEWQDVQLLRVETDNVTTGFNVLLTLKHFKGYHNKARLTITFRLDTTSHPRNLLLDYGSVLVAHMFRSGAFGSQSLRDVLQDHTATVKCIPAFDKLPVFRAQLSRNRMTRDRPLQDVRANLRHQRLLRGVGIATGKKGHDTFYACRRAFASNMKKHMDPSVAKFFLGHMANSSMLESIYDQSNLDLNVVAGVLGTEEAHETISTPAILKRITPSSAEPSASTMGAALMQIPQAKHIMAKLALLKSCMTMQSSAWITVEPYKSMIKQDSNSVSMVLLPVFIHKLTYQLRAYMSDIKADFKLAEVKRMQTERDLLTVAEIANRRVEADQPSDLAVELQQRLIAQERIYLEENTSDIHVHVNVPQMDDALDGSDQADDEDNDEPIELDEGDDDAMPAEEDGDASGNRSDEGSSEEVEFELNVSGLSKADTAAERSILTAGAEMVDREADQGETQHNGTGLGITKPLDRNVDKMTFLHSIATLENVVEGGHCELCLTDSTASEKDKARIFGPGHLLRKHQTQFHSAQSTTRRWCIAQRDPATQSYRCPFNVGEGAEADVEMDVASPAACGCIRRYKRDFSNHIAMLHPHAVTELVLQGLSPETRGLAKQEHKQALENAGYKRSEQGVVRAVVKGLPGTFGAQGVALGIGQGGIQAFNFAQTGGWEDAPLNNGVEAIPDGLILPDGTWNI